MDLDGELDMDATDELASAAWREAAVDLAIRVTAPYIRAASNGKTVECIAFVPDFGSPRGLAVRGLWQTQLQDVPINIADAVISLAIEVAGHYDRHEWIDLLEGARWFGAGDPPWWYTAISPWHRDQGVMRQVADELARIFGRRMEVERSAPYRRLDLLPGDEVLAFLGRVPAGGVTAQSFSRWTLDVADEWNRRHPRLRSAER